MVETIIRSEMNYKSMLNMLLCACYTNTILIHNYVARNSLLIINTQTQIGG